MKIGDLHEYKTKCEFKIIILFVSLHFIYKVALNIFLLRKFFKNVLSTGSYVGTNINSQCDDATD